MLRPALDFGNSGIVRFYCDGCDKPIITGYKGKYGQYCSRACLKLYDVEKVKAPDVTKVKSEDTEKVKIESKVKNPPSAKVKTAQAPVSASKVKILTRKQKRIRRRAAIQRIRNEILVSTGREPTIAQLQEHLAPLGLWASVRTVWKDSRIIPLTTKGPI
jgi:hypothetical protein